MDVFNKSQDHVYTQVSKVRIYQFITISQFLVALPGALWFACLPHAEMALGS